MKKIICLFMLLLFFLGSFSDAAYAKKNKNSLPQKPTAQEAMAIQTRSYNNVDTFVLMKAILNVLQDNYYFVEDADYKLGFIKADRQIDTKDKYINIKEEFGCSKKATWIKQYSVAKTELNINVTQNEDNINSVRLSIRKKIVNVYDIEVKVDDIYDKELYDKFFIELNKKLNKNNICAADKKEIKSDEKKEIKITENTPQKVKKEKHNKQPLKK